jgi:protoporphyrinogen oxidase
VLERGLGRTICRDFYFPYAAKIWGVDPAELDVEQARRRVSAGSLGKMIRKVLNALPGLKPEGAGRFYYPRRGYGQISESYCQAAIDAGVSVRLQTVVSGIELEKGRAAAVRVNGETGTLRLAARQVLSTIPLPVLACLIEPGAPPEVLAAARSLEYRAMILVYLALETDRFTEFDAHYFPAAEVAITRLSEPKNYGLAGPDGRTVLCAELPCSTEDPIWKAGDERLQQLVLEALARADLPVRAPVLRVATRRLRQAYPIYTRGYREHFERLDSWVGGIDRLVTFGRQGLFAHDNTHHALAMAYAASLCIDDAGDFDRQRWAAHRKVFESHVVED